MFHRFKFLIAALVLLSSLTACGMSERDRHDPLTGNFIELKSSLYILRGLDKFPSFTNSPTAIKLGNVSVTTHNLRNCAGCNFSVMTLHEFLPVGSRIKIVKSYETVAPFLHIGSSGMAYYIAETGQGTQFAIAKYLLEDVLQSNPAYNDEAYKLEVMLQSFTDSTEKKSYFIQTKDFYKERLFPDKQTPFTADDVKYTFTEVFSDIGTFNITIYIIDGQLAFSATTDREGLAYLILKTSEKYADISPHQKIN